MPNHSALAPIMPKRNYEAVSEQIKQAIRNGQFQPGERIPAEADLIESFGVGRGSIREAIKSLQIQGILSSHPGKGTFVTDDALVRIHNSDLLATLHQEESIKHLLEVRLLLEPQIAYYAAVRGSDADTRALFSIVREMKACESRAEIMISGGKFHQKLADMCDNPILLNLYDIVSEPLVRLRRMEFVTMGIYLQGTDEHLGIAQAVKSRNGELAKKLMYDHLIADYPSYLKLLEENIE